MMVSEGNPVFTPHPTPQPVPNGVRTAVNLVASPGPNMEARFARSLAQQEQRFKELCEVRGQLTHHRGLRLFGSSLSLCLFLVLLTSKKAGML